ncbi:putative ATP-dependent RNA helicase DDX43 [Ooceraea biroi]|uniref:Putative ATP-dependent RNA helicase DDX43 n=1 Tax=Ooceraea biroi TaxID=2015173 RepID=A0A026WVQ4_OOCBI|nr:putative ATP-dependent RNA helicase DDX43 [Ooceraea biroi]
MDNIASDLAITNIDCRSIHGDRKQQDREQVLDDLNTRAVQILFATDMVASRRITFYAHRNCYLCYLHFEEDEHTITGRPCLHPTAILTKCWFWIY